MVRLLGDPVLLTNNHFVHVTTSNILALLPHTKTASGAMILCNMDRLLLDYQLAPLSGEITRGGGTGIINDMSTAFARVGDTYWGQEQLLTSYGRISMRQAFSSKADLYDNLAKEANCQFKNIMVTLIQLLRDYHMGKLPILSSEQVETLKNIY